MASKSGPLPFRYNSEIAHERPSRDASHLEDYAMINDLLEEMLFCEFMLVCESYDCRAFFEFEEVANDPMDDWAKRAAVAARACGWTIGHTGLVKCAKCAARVD